MLKKEFRDRDGAPLSQNSFYIDPSLNNVSIYHRYCVIEDIGRGQVLIRYLADDRREQFIQPEYSSRFKLQTREQVETALKDLENLTQGFNRALKDTTTEAKTKGYNYLGRPIVLLEDFQDHC